MNFYIPQLQRLEVYQVHAHSLASDHCVFASVVDVVVVVLCASQYIYIYILSVKQCHMSF
jgi:hypothetical protein